jgi:hypothetical protein
MKNHVAILLAMTLLAQGMAPLVRQLSKIPALVAHYYAHHDHVHHDHGEELAITDFLAQHYAGKAHHDDASREHSNLPFACGDVAVVPLLLALPSEFPLPEGNFTRVFLQKAVFASTELYSGLYKQDVFRPPLG